MHGLMSTQYQNNHPMSLYHTALQNTNNLSRNASYQPNGTNKSQAMKQKKSSMLKKMDMLEREAKRKEELDKFRKELEEQYMQKEIDNQKQMAQDFNNKYLVEKEQEYKKERERLLEEKRKKEHQEKMQQRVNEEWEKKQKKVFNKLKAFLLSLKYIMDAGKSYRQKNLDKKEIFINDNKNIYAEKIKPLLPEIYKVLEPSLKPIYGCKKKHFIIIYDKFILKMYNLEPIKPKVVETNNAYIIVI